MSFVPLSRLFHSQRTADCPVAFVDGEFVDFGTFRRDVAFNARMLREAGCRRSALYCADAYWFAVGLMALFHAGATVVLPANGLPAMLAALADRFDSLVIDVGVEAAPPYRTTSFRLGKGVTTDGPCRLEPFDPCTAQIECFTSGSTGTPKCIAKPVTVLECEAQTLDTLWRDQAGRGLVLSTVSHQHVYGHTFKVIWPLCAGRPFSGATQDLWEGIMPHLAAGTMLITSPAHLTRIAGITPLRPGTGPAMVFSAGAPLPAAAAAESAKILGVRPTEIYGSTETGAIASRRATGEAEPWRPLPGITIKRTADRRLAIRSPFVAATDWHQTDDSVEIAADGRFQLKGRADRVVKIEGKRVSLPELEQLLAALPWIGSAAAAMTGPKRQRLGAVVTLTAEGRQKLDELGPFRFGRFLRRALSEAQESAGLPRSWRFLDALPTGHMGKRSEADIAALFDAEMRDA